MKLKDKINELEQKHRLIADNLMDAIWVVDAETLKFEYITDSVEKISGYSPDEYLNSRMDEMITSDSLAKAIKILDEEKAKFKKDSKTVRTIELERVNKDGSLKWIEIRAKFYKEKDQPLKIVGVTRDIDKRKKAELKQDELIESLGQALAEKEKLLKENKVLRGLLPICSGCKRIRDNDGRWWPLDAYITKKTEAELTHTICQDCKDIYYSEIDL